MNLTKLQEILTRHDQSKFRLEQIQKAIFGDSVSTWDEITTISKDLREILKKEFNLLSFEVEKILEAKNGQSAKALLKLSDGNLIETVLISPKPGIWSACVSCQVGCQMGCRFCATGRLGWQRDLTAEEITDQVLFWKQYLKNKFRNPKSEIRNCDIGNIVYMGMGEPFLNWENVRESLKIFTDNKLFGFGSRSISVSTSGIPDGIRKLAEEFSQINLAVSLHFADDEKRSRFMPVNIKYNLGELCESLRDYFQKTKRKVFIEYILLDGINDSVAEAKKVVDYLKSVGRTHLLHVNLIRYNPTGEELKSSSGNKAQKFKNYLLKNKINATIRKSVGEEIQGACGQLAGR